jgi:hypothetical protein
MKTIEVNTKFEVGDVVYAVIEDWILAKIDCPVCKGKYLRTIAGDKFKCINCYHGKISGSYIDTFLVSKDTIVGLDIHMEQDIVTISYRVREAGAPTNSELLYSGEDVDNLFATRKQANDAIKYKKKALKQ